MPTRPRRYGAKRSTTGTPVVSVCSAACPPQYGVESSGRSRPQRRDAHQLSLALGAIQHLQHHVVLLQLGPRMGLHEELVLLRAGSRIGLHEEPQPSF
eukprot:1749330-Heterocapsa_arctica.AAC.1